MDSGWYSAESTGSQKPTEIDESSSRKYIYLRKNIEFVPSSKTLEGEETENKWVFLETKIPKEIANLLNMTKDNTSSIADIEDALCEISMEM